MNILQKIALTLTIIGAINWGLIGLFNFNLVDTLFGVDSFLSMLIYILVGIAVIIYRFRWTLKKRSLYSSNINGVISPFFLLILMRFLTIFNIGIS